MFFHQTIFLFILFLTLSFGSITQAATLKDAFGSDLKTVTTGAGYNPNTNGDSALTIVSSIINVFLSLLGVIFLCLMIYGGYLWMMDQGNNDKMKKAINLISAAITGLIIVVLAYTISYFVVYKISQKTLSESTSPGQTAIDTIPKPPPGN